MIYESQGMQLNTIRVVRKGTANDVYICRDDSSQAGSLYTLWVVRDHNIVRQLLHMFESKGDRMDAYLGSFSWNGDFCMVFPYKAERPMRSFYNGDKFPLPKCEVICSNLVTACMTEGVPYPVLYLMLQQEQIHLAKDDSVFFSYQVGLEELDSTVGEKECVVQCARILMELLTPKSYQKAISYTLVKKKVEKKSYNSFLELYKDIQIASQTSTKIGLRARLNTELKVQKDRIFRALLILSLALILLVLVSLLAQVIFGEAPWLRIFSNHFRIIGTENLVQK